jgi:hypothetical protein
MDLRSRHKCSAFFGGSSERRMFDLQNLDPTAYLAPIIDQERRNINATVHLSPPNSSQFVMLTCEWLRAFSSFSGVQL